MRGDRAERTRAAWLETLAAYTRDRDRPGSADYWSPSLDCASRDELRAIQDAKLASLTPFLDENSAFYRRRFDRRGLAPTDIRTVDDLPRWPVVDKTEMMEDLKAAPPQEAVRAVSGIGDDYEIVLETSVDGLDVMTVRVEHPDRSIAERVAKEVRTRCEVRCDVDVLAPGTLPKTEFKARRIRDTRPRP